MKLTEWFYCEYPVRSGVYQRLFGVEVRYAYFSLKSCRFAYSSNTPQSALKNYKDGLVAGNVNFLPWRGIEK